MSNRRMKLEPHEELRLFNTYQRRCVGCGRRGKLEIDHVRSVADGGEDAFSNAQPLCPRCNTYKGDRSLDLRGWRGAAPFRLYRRVFWKPGRRRVNWRKLAAVLARPLAIVVLAVTLLFVVTPLEDAIAGTLATAWQGVRWYVYLVLGVFVLVWLAGKWEDRQWVYPDEYGQLPWRKSVLKQNPEHSVRSNVVHQKYQIIRANRYIGEKVSIRMDQPREQPQLDVAPSRIPIDHWFANLVTYDAHLMLVGGTGSGKSTIARALLAARAQTDAIVILDPHGRMDYTDPEQYHLNDWLGLVSVGAGRDFAAIERMITTIHAEFQRRSVPGNKLGQGITVFIDEVPAIVSETDDAMGYVVKWIREIRKYGIRIILLTQGKEVKTLGIEGEGSIRDSLQTVLLGGHAKGVPGNEHAGQYAGALVNGNTYSAKEDAHAIDTSGVPSLPVRQLDELVVWQPDAALLTATTTTEGPKLLEIGQKNSSSSGLTPEQVARVLALHDEQRSLSAIAKSVIGYTGGGALDKVRVVLSEAGQRVE